MVSKASRNIALIVAYDGSTYCGWQDNGLSQSVEAELQSVLQRILQHPVQLQASSRTDAGVHAEGQVANFFTSKSHLDLERLLIGINALLPKDIAVLRLWEAESTFHPTLDNIGKEYHYHVCYGKVQMPQQRCYQWHYPHFLNLDQMCLAANQLVGTHDFQAFCNKREGLSYDHTIRTVSRIEVVKLPDMCLRIELEGNAFLYKMARNIAGTLVYVGCGKLMVDDIATILQEHDRKAAGMTAPAHGLVLKRVFFEGTESRIQNPESKGQNPEFRIQNSE